MNSKNWKITITISTNSVSKFITSFTFPEPESNNICAAMTTKFIYNTLIEFTTTDNAIIVKNLFEKYMDCNKFIFNKNFRFTDGSSIRLSGRVTK